LKTHKQQILDAICALDADRLDDLLDPKYTYQDKIKSLFISDLREQLESYNQKGDTHLIPYMGCCRNNGCDTKKCNGYLLYGAKSGDAMSYIFQENEEGQVYDIFVCNDFLVDESEEAVPPNLKEANPDHVVHNDADTELDLARENQIIQAISDLAALSILTYQSVDGWLRKHRSLYAEVYMKYEQFSDVYELLICYIQAIDMSPLLEEICQARLTLDPANERQILDFLVKYEDEIAHFPIRVVDKPIHRDTLNNPTIKVLNFEYIFLDARPLNLPVQDFYAFQALYAEKYSFYHTAVEADDVKLSADSQLPSLTEVLLDSGILVSPIKLDKMGVAAHQMSYSQNKADFEFIRDMMKMALTQKYLTASNYWVYGEVTESTLILHPVDKEIEYYLHVNVSNVPCNKANVDGSFTIKEVFIDDPETELSEKRYGLPLTRQLDYLYEYLPLILNEDFDPQSCDSDEINCEGFRDEDLDDFDLPF
jgi:hypothetical protein